MGCLPATLMLLLLEIIGVNTLFLDTWFWIIVLRQDRHPKSNILSCFTFDPVSWLWQLALEEYLPIILIRRFHKRLVLSAKIFIPNNCRN